MINYALSIISFLLVVYITGVSKGRCSFFWYFLCLLVIVLIVIQVTSLLTIGSYVPALAISNIREASEVGNGVVIKFISILIPALIFTLVFSVKMKRISPWYAKYILFPFLFIPGTPIYGVIDSLSELVKENNIYSRYAKDRDVTYKALYKNSVSVDSNKDEFISERKNIIVIFTEGMSYDVISEKITPNIYKFSKRSLNIINYYNHTAATFRGLRGQLSSSHQVSGGYTKDGSGIGQLTNDSVLKKFNGSSSVDSLINDIKNNNYNAFFQAANRRSAQLSVMLSTLGFDRIYGIDDEVNLKKWQIDELTDKESYSMILKNAESFEKEGKPFFYGVYTVGTHIGLDSPDEKYGNGDNPYLNKFHNLDYQFGKFIDEFDKSSLSKNTTVIFTADHATYPEPGFVKTFGTKSPYFVDRIPLMIYQKGMNPSVINANGINSLSLAPTIADILNFNNMKNHFIGVSLFSRGRHSDLECISAIGSFYVKTCGGKISMYDGDELTKIKKLQNLGR